MSCPSAVRQIINKSSIISIAHWNPSLSDGISLLERSEVRVGCSGTNGNAHGLNLTFVALSTFKAKGGGNASVGPGSGSSCFAGDACLATGAAST